MDSQGLRDVAIVGASFTWSNMQSPPTLRKLDRFFLSAEWNQAFPFSIGLARLRLVSDHILLVLCGKMACGAPRPFKFENIWLQFSNFNVLVKG